MTEPHAPISNHDQGAASWSFGERWPNLAEGTVDAVVAYLREKLPLSIADGSGIIGRLERRLSKVLGIGDVVTTSSGTAALHSAYLALDLPVGSEVICPVVTFHASITPALHCGLRPVLADVEPDTGNLSPQALASAITSETRCVVVNHNWGHPADMAAIIEICQDRDVAVIEDCAHAYLATYRGRPVGTFGDIAVWSMHAKKILPAGEGGFLATSDRGLFERACLVGHYRGRSYRQVTDPTLHRFAETGFGLKYRLHPLAAVIAFGELEHLPARVARRRNLMGALSTRLDDVPGISPPVVRPDVEPGWYGYKPAFLPDEVPVDCDTYLGLLRAEGLDVHRPSVRPLNELALFSGPVPVESAVGTWTPRLCGPFDGCRAYFENRLSVPTFTGPSGETLVEQYAEGFRRVSATVRAAR